MLYGCQLSYKTWIYIHMYNFFLFFLLFLRFRSDSVSLKTKVGYWAVAENWQQYTKYIYSKKKKKKNKNIRIHRVLSQSIFRESEEFFVERRHILLCKVFSRFLHLFSFFLRLSFFQVEFCQRFSWLFAAFYTFCKWNLYSYSLLYFILQDSGIFFLFVFIVCMTPRIEMIQNASSYYNRSQKWNSKIEIIISCCSVLCFSLFISLYVSFLFSFLFRSEQKQ